MKHKTIVIPERIKSFKDLEDLIPEPNFPWRPLIHFICSEKIFEDLKRFFPYRKKENIVYFRGYPITKQV
jgi:hypothetical protein